MVGDGRYVGGVTKSDSSFSYTLDSLENKHARATYIIRRGAVIFTDIVAQ